MQGFNMGRYVPPDAEGSTTGNKLHNKRFGAVGGQQTVRFEMPFAVWCSSCPKPTIIGQGVRFNAAKRKVGQYHSTPIFAFRMRHTECSGTIEIRTDPAHTTYVVTEGGSKRDTGEPSDAGDLAAQFLSPAEREQQRSSAFAKLEKTIADRAALARAGERIEELEAANARAWEDPYERNRRLRAAFRVGRHERERDGRATEDLRDRLSLGIDLLPGTEEDARRAALVDFGPSSTAENNELGRKALAKPLFSVGTGGSGRVAKGSSNGKSETKAKTKTKHKMLKSEIAAAQMRDTLVSEIVGNTRAAQDPFLSLDRDRGGGGESRTAARIPGIKRKRSEPESEPEPHNHDEPKVKRRGSEAEDIPRGIAPTPAALVEYDSD
ncbi:Protein saf4 [Parahypoxylon ruwenzoriense]